VHSTLLLTFANCLVFGAALQAPAVPSKPPIILSAVPTQVDGPAISVGGIVEAPDGKPVAGAPVLLRLKMGGRSYSGGMTGNRDVLARTTTDAAGRFAFEKIGIPLRCGDLIRSLIGQNGGAELDVLAKGWGITWVDVNSATTKEPIRIVLSPAAKVEGVVRAKAGKAEAGVHIRVFGITKATNDLDSMFHEPGDMNLTFSEVVLDAKTDDAGRFALQNVPTGYRIAAAIERPGLTRNVFVIDTGGGPSAGQIRFGRAVGGAREVVRSPIELTAEPKRVVMVRVLDADGRPVTGGSISASDGRSRLVGFQEVDSLGTAAFAIREPDRYHLAYHSGVFTPRMGASLDIDFAEQGTPPVVEMRVQRGTFISGSVVDADTGKGIPGALITYRQEKPAPANSTGSQCLSDADGSFRIPVVAGPGRVMVGELYGYLQPASTIPRTIAATARPNADNAGAPVPTPEKKDPIQSDAEIAIDVPAQGQMTPITLKLARGLAIRGKVVDAEGKPVAGAVVHGRNEEVRASQGQSFTFMIERAAATTDGEGRFELAGLWPQQKSEIEVFSNSVRLECCSWRKN
jgi:hypothetical protein